MNPLPHSDRHSQRSESAFGIARPREIVKSSVDNQRRNEVACTFTTMGNPFTETAQHVLNYMTSLDITTQQKDKQNKELILSIKSLQEQAQPIELENKKLNILLVKERDLREEILRKIVVTRDLCLALTNKVEEVDKQLDFCHQCKIEIEKSRDNQMRNFQNLTHQFEEMKISYEQEISALKEEIVVYQETHNDTVQSLNAMISDRDMQIEQLNSNIIEKNEKINNYHGLAMDYKNTLENISKQNEGLVIEIKQLQSVGDMQLLKIKDLEEYIRKEQNEKRELKSECECLSSKLEDSQKLYSDIESKFQDFYLEAASEKERLCIKTEELKKQMNDLQQSNADQCKEWKVQVTELKQKNDNFQGDITKLESTIKQQTTLMEKKEKEYIKSEEAFFEEKQCLVAKLEICEKHMVEKQEECSLIQRQYEELQIHESSLKCQLEELKEQLLNKESHHKMFREKENYFSTQLLEKNEKVLSIQNAHDELIKENSVLKNEITKMKSEIEQSVCDLKDEISSKEVNIISLKNEISSLMTQVRSSGMNYESLNDKLKFKEIEAKELEFKLTEYEQKRAALETEIIQRDEEIEKFRVECEKLSSKAPVDDEILEKKDQEIKKLTELKTIYYNKWYELQTSYTKEIIEKTKEITKLENEIILMKQRHMLESARAYLKNKSEEKPNTSSTDPVDTKESKVESSTKTMPVYFTKHPSLFTTSATKTKRPGLFDSSGTHVKSKSDEKPNTSSTDPVDTKESKVESSTKTTPVYFTKRPSLFTTSATKTKRPGLFDSVRKPTTKPNERPVAETSDSDYFEMEVQADKSLKFFPVKSKASKNVKSLNIQTKDKGNMGVSKPLGDKIQSANQPCTPRRKRASRGEKKSGGSLLSPKLSEHIYEPFFFENL